MAGAGFGAGLYLMINGTMGVYADKGGVLQEIPLSQPYTNDKLQQAIQRIARLLGQDLTPQNPILNTRLPDGSRVAVVGAPSSINGPSLTIRKFNRWFSSDELIDSGSMPREVRDTVVRFMGERKNGIPTRQRVSQFFQKSAEFDAPTIELASRFTDLALRREITDEQFALEPLGLGIWKVPLMQNGKAIEVTDDEEAFPT